MRPVLLLAIAALAGCVEAAEPALQEPSSEAAPPIRAPRVDVSRQDWLVAASAGPTGLSLACGCDGHWELEAADNATGVIVEMAWQAGPLNQTMALKVQRWDDATAGFVNEVVVKAEGASPLRVTLGAEDLHGRLVIHATPAGDAGAVHEAHVVLFVATFEGIPFDPAFSALGQAPPPDRL